MAKLENKVDNLTEQVDKINKKMNKMEEGDLPQGMREAVEKIAGPQKEDKGENEALMHEIANETSKKEMAEFRDRTRRATNLVVFRLEEDTSKGKGNGQTKDEESVQKLLGEIKGTHQPTEIRRLGKLFSGKEKDEAPQEEKDAGRTKKIRPLRVTFVSENARDETLKAFYKAKKQVQEQSEEKDPRTISKITLRKDLTPKEREEEEALYQELKQRKEE
ncbi:hypothetical protein ACOMHN_029750 [Nucella lapillus]